MSLSSSIAREKFHPPSAAGNEIRRRAYHATEWARIRSTFEHLYIDQDMTLKDAMRKLEKDNNFNATESMYKKRIKAWGLTKHIKADEKDEALANLLTTEVSTRGKAGTIRHDKLVRHAKSRAKVGALRSQDLNKILGLDAPSGSEQPIIQSASPQLPILRTSSRGVSPAISLSRSPKPPDEFAKFDLFLRGMQQLIVRERQEWLASRQTRPDVIYTALMQGLMLWHANAFTAARKSFGWAARRLADDIRGSVVLVSRITFCISSIIWGSHHEVVFQMFAQFMANVAVEVLGHTCPLTVVLLHLLQEQSLDAQLVIWACALDDYQLSEENVDHWWNMAQRRWRWCRHSGRVDLATQYCQRALVEMRRIDRLTPEMESELYRELESFTAATGR